MPDGTNKIHRNGMPVDQAEFDLIVGMMNTANAHCDVGTPVDLHEAEVIVSRIVQEYPTFIPAVGLLSYIYGEQNRIGAALITSMAAVQMSKAANGEQAEYWTSYAINLKRCYHTDAARQCFERALELNPNLAHIYFNYSGLEVMVGNFEHAEQLARKGMELDPDNAINRTHLAMALLSLGKWEEAWEHFEYRKKKKGEWQRPEYEYPTWTGEPVETLLLHGEQGIGDELFLLTLVPRIKSRVKRLVIEATPRLVPILRRSFGCEVYASIAECEAHGVTNDGQTYICAMGSLPGVLNLSRSESCSGPYLIADEVRNRYWRRKLEAIAKGRPIIGVAWRGGVEQTHMIYRNPPRQMFRQLDPTRYCLVSVQYGPGAEKMAADCGWLHFQQAIDDLDEQASIIGACDRIVTVAQTAMHFGGALGIPTTALISSKPKWDCGRFGEENPWWKSVKTIRQEGDDWQGVFDRLRLDLGETEEEIAESRKPKSVATVDLSHISIGGDDGLPGALDAPAADARGGAAGARDAAE